MALKVVGSNPIIHPIKFRFLLEIGTFPLYSALKVHSIKLAISLDYCRVVSKNQIPLYQIQLLILPLKLPSNSLDPDLTQTGNFTEAPGGLLLHKMRICDKMSETVWKA